MLDQDWFPIGWTVWNSLQSKGLSKNKLKKKKSFWNAGMGCSVAQSCPTLCNPTDCSTPGFAVLLISWSLLKLMSIESVIPSSHLSFCHPLLLQPSSLPASRSFLMSWLFTSGGHILELQLQHQFFQWIFRVYFP